ncbi:hypothetical protein [Geoglobus acetivorans]|uniref:Uncharacterized protein n=1 Tax=Geoglobus acetivorans TaxID=565033 RepID=A0A0A7GJN4_GEOAI|nr:hypothetical protein GACE_2114 [Geoglobus acetivorans]
MDFQEELKKALDRIDELSVLLNTLNRVVGKQDWAAAYTISRQIGMKATTIMDCFSNINFIMKEEGR